MVERFGVMEAKSFCDGHEDVRVQLLWKMLLGCRSKSAMWCDALVKSQSELKKVKAAAASVVIMECERVNEGSGGERYDAIANPGQFDERVVALAWSLEGGVRAS